MFRTTAQKALKMMDPASSSAPFSRAVFQAMRTLYPESLADKSWDNTGLLLEAPFDPLRRQKNSVLLTVDLTRAVANEAIDRKVSVVIAYHPIIFKGLKSLTMADTQQTSLLRLVAQGISVYSPHTALDSAAGGINDWLADIVTGTLTSPSDVASNTRQSMKSADVTETEAKAQALKLSKLSLAHHPSTASLRENASFNSNSIEHTREPIQPFPSGTHPGAGQGRLVTFARPQSLVSLLQSIANGVGSPKGFPVAIPQHQSIEEIAVRTVGICAGSGGGLLAPLKNVDVLFTGELSHHEALAAIERGQVVVTLFHSNTERGFLHSVLKHQLEEQVRIEWDKIRVLEAKTINESEKSMTEAFADHQVNIEVSSQDRDPYGIVMFPSP